MIFNRAFMEIRFETGSDRCFVHRMVFLRLR